MKENINKMPEIAEQHTTSKLCHIQSKQYRQIGTRPEIL